MLTILKRKVLFGSYLSNLSMFLAHIRAFLVGELEGVHVVTGSQAEAHTLRRWIKESGGNFDIIVDDGSHHNHHIYNSFEGKHHTKYCTHPCNAFMHSFPYS